MARPKTGRYDPDKMAEIIDDYVDQCVKKKAVPILKEVTTKQGWCYDYVMEMSRKLEMEDKHNPLTRSIKRLMDAKEYLLERNGLNGTVQSTMAIFSLKQMGWKDKTDVDITADENALKLQVKLVAAE